MASPLKRRRSESATPAQARKAPRRVATVYDAVAGRIGTESFLQGATDTDAPFTREGAPVYPEEVLFRQKNAPIRYEETDTYFAHERLDPATQRLPSSDLLKAIHRYASHFYAGDAAKHGGGWDWRSMDETALLAMGILLEEAIAHDIGPTGDLAFVEGEDADQGVAKLDFWDGQQHRRSVLAGGNVSAKRSRELKDDGNETQDNDTSAAEET